MDESTQGCLLFDIPGGKVESDLRVGKCIDLYLRRQGCVLLFC